MIMMTMMNTVSGHERVGGRVTAAGKVGRSRLDDAADMGSVIRRLTVTRVAACELDQLRRATALIVIVSARLTHAHSASRIRHLYSMFALCLALYAVSLDRSARNCPLLSSTGATGSGRSLDGRSGSKVTLMSDCMTSSIKLGSGRILHTPDR
jgi:hypothetical protein